MPAIILLAVCGVGAAWFAVMGWRQNKRRRRSRARWQERDRRAVRNLWLSRWIGRERRKIRITFLPGD